jgi:adenylate cyclase
MESDGSRRLSAGGAVSQRHSFWIAVRPLKAPPADADLQGFGEGLVEEITAGLSRFSHLSVAAHDATPETRYLLDGSIRKSGTVIRVNVQLEDVQNGTQMWAESYNRDFAGADPFAVQDDVTDRVVATVADVHGVLARSMMHALREISIEHLSSSDLLLRYWSYHHNPKREEHARLRSALEAIAAREPNNAEVWAALGYLYTHEYSHWFNAQPDPLTRARHAVDRSLELDRAGQHGWEALAVASFFERDRHAFLAAADRAMAINPRNTNTAAFMALLLARMGQSERALAIIERARRLNSHHPGWYHVVEFDYHYQAGDYDAAYAAVKRINMPELVFPQIVLADVCGQLGRADEAKAALRSIAALEPRFAQPEIFPEMGRRWFWNEDVHKPYTEGFRKALALAKK